MSYLSLQRKLENHELAALGVLTAAFAAAFVLMFVHPTGALLIFGLSLIFLMVMIIVGRFILRAERTVAREALTHGDCPKCGADVQTEADDTDTRHCPACGADFLLSGIERH
jgi:hypothetical protein